MSVHHEAGLAAFLQNNSFPGHDSNVVRLFDPIEQTCTPDLLLGGAHEILARAIHDHYLQKQCIAGKNPTTNHSFCSWEQLPDMLKNSNRRQADDINRKLKAIGCTIDLCNDWECELLEFTNDEIEKMAIMEDQRWIDERGAEGWSFASGEKSAEAKSSPYLVPWSELTDDMQELDRNTVRQLPLFLAKAGLEIYRQDGPRREIRR